MMGPSVSRRAKTPVNYPALTQTALVQLLGTATPFATKKTVQTYAVQFSATVTAFDNSFLSTPAKVDLAGAVDAAGDRSGILRIIGLNAAGAYQYEDLALNAGNSSTATASVNTYSKVFALQNRHSGAWTTGQNITCKATGTNNVICTLPAGSARYVKVTSALNIPRHYGTFTGTPASGGTYVTDAGWWNTVAAVYNITDDASKTTNLWSGNGFDQDEDLTGGFSAILNGYAVGTQNAYLNTGVGSAKTYEVQGTYVPYQGILNGSETLELVWLDPSMWVLTSGTGVPGAGTIYGDYVPVSVKLPLTNGIDEVLFVRGALAGTGMANPQSSSALVNIALFGFNSATTVPFIGGSVTVGSASDKRGFQKFTMQSTTLTLFGGACTSVGGGSFAIGLAKVTSPGTNTSLSVGELVLVAIGRHSATMSSLRADISVDAFKLSSNGVFV
jgi:hypothetical protein